MCMAALRLNDGVLPVAQKPPPRHPYEEDLGHTIQPWFLLDRAVEGRCMPLAY